LLFDKTYIPSTYIVITDIKHRQNKTAQQSKSL